MDDSVEAGLARQLIALRQAQARRDYASDELPRYKSSAYRTASASLAIDGQGVAAWKLGATTAGTRRTFATDAIYFGALTGAEVWRAGGSAMPVPPPVFRAEAEIAFRLAVDLAPADIGRITAGMPAETIFDAWTPALEAPYSCIANIPEAGLMALLVDRCAAGALFLGAPRPDVNDAAIGAEIEILVDGEPIAAATASAALLMSPLTAALGFLEEAAAHGVTLSRGQWIATGGITPCVDLPRDRRIGLRFGGVDVFTLDLAPCLDDASA